MARSRLALNLGLALLLIVGLWVATRKGTEALLGRTGRPSPPPAPAPPGSPRGPGSVYVDNGTPQDLVLEVDGKRWGVVPAYRAVSLAVPEGWHRFVALAGETVFDEVRAWVEVGTGYIFNPGRRNQYRAVLVFEFIGGCGFRPGRKGAPVPALIARQWFEGSLPPGGSAERAGAGPARTGIQLQRVASSTIPLRQAIAIVESDGAAYADQDHGRAMKVLALQPPLPEVQQALISMIDRMEDWRSPIEALDILESKYAERLQDETLIRWLARDRDHDRDSQMCLAVRLLLGRGRWEVIRRVYFKLPARRRAEILELVTESCHPIPAALRELLVADLATLLQPDPKRHEPGRHLSIARAALTLGATDALVTVLSRSNREALTELAGELVSERPYSWRDGPAAVGFATALLGDPDHQIRWWAWRFLVGRRARRPDLRQTLTRAASREPDPGLQSYVQGQLARSAPRD